jgi:hypothetical protein
MNDYVFLNNLLNAEFDDRLRQLVIHVNDERSLKMLNDLLGADYSISSKVADFKGGIYYTLINRPA